MANVKNLTICVLMLALVSTDIGVGSDVSVESYAMRFGIVTDCHYADRAEYTNPDVDLSRYYRHSLDKLGDCVTHMNDEEVDFLIELGDLKDQDEGLLPGQTDPDTLTYLAAIEAVFQNFTGPKYYVMGNHDVDSISKDDFWSAVSDPRSDSSVSYYSFDINGLHCIVLDACYMEDDTPYDTGNFGYEWQHPFIPKAQRNWLEADLAATTNPTIVFIHQVLGGSDDDHGVDNAGLVRTILEDSGKVAAVFQGHDHRGPYAEINGIHYYTLKAMVAGSYYNSDDSKNPDNNSYAIVEVQVQPCGSITVTGYGNATSMELETNLDLDLDGVPDCQDECLDTPSGVFVGPFGCSAYQWCTFPKYEPKNHGDFVRCVTYIAEAWLDEDFIDEEQKNEIVSEAAKSGVGKR